MTAHKFFPRSSAGHSPLDSCLDCDRPRAEHSPYPIRIRVTRKVVEELYVCEEGRHEDSRSDGEVCHAYEVASRAISSRSAVLEVRDQDELTDLYYAVCSGTFSRYHWKTANKIADTLRPFVSAVDPVLVSQWPAPWDDGSA